MTRLDCTHGPRPCPWVSCRYHLFTEVRRSGKLTTTPGYECPTEMPVTCALDVAEHGGATLEDVSELMGVTKERVRQLECVALDRIARRLVEFADPANESLEERVLECLADESLSVRALTDRILSSSACQDRDMVGGAVRRLVARGTLHRHSWETTNVRRRR